MMASIDTAALWKRLLQTHLGRKLSCNSAHIALDILCVDVGVKPGFLFDYGAVSVEQMGCLLQCLHREHLTTNRNLWAVCVDTDVIIVNLESLEQCLKFVRTHGSFIDVSAKRELPCLTERNSGLIKSSLTTVDVIYSDICGTVTDNKHYTAHITSSANVSTIYGLLLGYPVIYWYESSDTHNMGKCLSMEPLMNFRIWGSKHLNALALGPKAGKNKGHNSERNVPSDSHLIYSFTVPERFLTSLQGDIDAWFTELHKSNKWKTVFREISCTQNVITEASVNL